MKNTNSLKTLLSQYSVKIMSFLNKELEKEGKKLPKQGILTGQGVADLILKFSGWDKYREEVELKLNDIDVFHCMTKAENAEHNRNKCEQNSYSLGGTTINTKRVAKLGFISMGYEGFIGAVNGSSYKIVKTEKYGLLNETYVFFPNEDKKRTKLERYESVISQFDINCTQVGIDIETGELLATNNFLKFYQTGQLEISYGGTPIHSPIRYVRKLKEHGFYGNIHNELTKMAFIQIIFSDYKSYFSDKQSETFDKYEDILSPYFRKTTFLHPEDSNIEQLGTNENGVEEFRISNSNERYGIYSLKVLEGQDLRNIVDLAQSTGSPETYDTAVAMCNIYFYRKEDYKKRFKKEISEELNKYKGTNRNYHLASEYSLAELTMRS